MYSISQITILGVRIDALTNRKVHERIKKMLASQGQNQIATVNAEFIMAAQKDESFKAILNNCSLNVADGIGVLWAAKFLSLTASKSKPSVSYSAGTKAADAAALYHSREWYNERLSSFVMGWWYLAITLASLILRPAYCRSVIPERVSGADLLIDICGIAAGLGRRVFLLGGKAGAADLAAQELIGSFPALNIAGVADGPRFKIYDFGFKNSEENMTTIEKINIARPDILFVAFNHPKAQYWIADNLTLLPSVRLAMGVGGAFDFLAGSVKRAPKTWQNLGLEWLWRLIRQPWRLPRIGNATFNFIRAVFKSGQGS